MKILLKSLSIGGRRLRSLRAALLAACAVGVESSTFAQSAAVLPRQTAILSSVTLSNTQTIVTNAALPVQAPGFTNVGFSVPTLIPVVGTHSIGLSLQIANTNAFAASSNFVVTVFPAYDLGGGNSGSIGQRYGTNFFSTPLLTWTVVYKTNVTAWTNIAPSLWEPATALGFQISAGGTATTAGAVSNIVATLIASVVP